jgi:hypothetical protein
VTIEGVAILRGVDDGTKKAREMKEEVKLGSVAYCCRPIDCNERNHVALAFGWSVVSRGKETLCSSSQAKREIKREDYYSISEDYQSAQLEEILECSLFCRSLL